MSAGKYTPGPWQYTGVFVEAKGEAIAAPCGDSDMRSGNGPLLAAAPEMHETLAQCRKYFDQYADIGTWQMDLLIQVNKVLAKAEGRQ